MQCRWSLHHRNQRFSFEPIEKWLMNFVFLSAFWCNNASKRQPRQSKFRWSRISSSRESNDMGNWIYFSSTVKFTIMSMTHKTQAQCSMSIAHTYLYTRRARPHQKSKQPTRRQIKENPNDVVRALNCIFVFAKRNCKIVINSSLVLS